VWDRWLAAHSKAERVPPPALGAAQYAPVDDAPGEYVRQK
jgi:poly(3-hydroxyalkanoate) synthetase